MCSKPLNTYSKALNICSKVLNKNFLLENQNFQGEKKMFLGLEKKLLAADCLEPTKNGSDPCGSLPSEWGRVCETGG